MNGTEEFYMQRWFLLIFVCVFGLSGFALQAAEEYTYEEGRVDFVVPTGWKHEITDESTRVYSPDDAVQFVFELLDADELKTALESSRKEIVSALGPTTFADPVEEDINGMPALTFEGTTKEKGLEVMVSLINTPADKILCVYYFGAKAAEEKHAAAIAEVIKGIQPVKKGMADKAAPVQEEDDSEGDSEEDSDE
jgi:hypothetical protein